MHYLRGIITWIDSLESGRQFRSWVAILLKILAVVISVGISVWGIIICVDTIGANNDSGLTLRILAIIGSILEVGIVIIVSTVLAVLFWNRSNKIRTLDKDPNFILISITVIIIQLAGEISFFGLIGTGVQSLVASIFGSGFPKLFTFLVHDRGFLGTVPPDLGETPNLIPGVILCTISILSGAALLIAAYFIAEEVNVLANIAESLNNMETKLLAEEPPSDS